jgi:uncharacterized protein YoxC
MLRCIIACMGIKLRAPHHFSIHEKLDFIIKQQEKIMSTFDDLKASLDTVTANVTTIKTDVEALLAKLAAIPTGGLTADQQAALDAAVTQAQGISTSLGAIDAEAKAAT